MYLHESNPVVLRASDSRSHSNIIMANYHVVSVPQFASDAIAHNFY